MNYVTPWWKKWWSYLSPILLETTSSDYNKHLEVLLVEGRHQLNTEDAIYSFDDKYENFYQAFQAIDWARLPDKNVLVLGLGLGSVMYILENKNKLYFDYTAVEIDPEICRLSHKYTTHKLQSSITTINADAQVYMQINQEKYDLIIMDIFQSAHIPRTFQSEEFLQQLSNHLHDNGLLMYNRMHLTDQDKLDYEAFLPKFNKIFPNSSSIDVKQNIIVINDKSYLL